MSGPVPRSVKTLGSHPLNGAPARPESKASPKLPIEPLVTIDGWTQILNVSRRSFERMRSAGLIPPPDVRVGRLPRWRPETVRRWIEGGGRP